MRAFLNIAALTCRTCEKTRFYAGFRPVRRIRGVFFVVLGFAFILGACTTEDKMLFVMTPYFDAAYPMAGEDLQEHTKDLGIDVRVQVFDPELTSSAFIEALASSTAPFVVVSPFLANLVAAAAPVYQERRFIILYADALIPQPNVQRVAIDRSTTYNRAGHFSADLLRNSAEESGGTGMLILASTGNERRRRELETFLSAYRDESTHSTPPVAVPEVYELASQADERTASRLLPEIAGNFDLVLITAGPLNAELLPAVAASCSAPIITEGVGGVLPAAERVVALVEEDWVSGIETAVDSRSPRVVMPSLLKPGPGVGRFDLGSAERFLQ